jgi:hypothetical protein
LAFGMVVAFFFIAALVFLAVGACFNGGHRGGPMVERRETAGGTIRRRLETGGRWCFSWTSLAPAEEEPCGQEMWASSTPLARWTRPA